MGIWVLFENYSVKEVSAAPLSYLVLLQESNVGIFCSKLIKFMWSSKVALYVHLLSALVGEKEVDITFVLAFSNGALNAQCLYFG